MNFSLIIATHHRERLERQRELYRQIKETSPQVEVIAVSDNPVIYDEIQGDQVVKLPRWVGWTKQINIGEKFATNETVGFLDDSVTIANPDWATLAFKSFYDRFPDGMGLLEYSGHSDCWSRGLSTRKYLYSHNLGNMLWPEYLHGGDEEIGTRAIKEDKFYSYPQILVNETKFPNSLAGKVISGLQPYNEWLFNTRKSQGFPLSLQPNWLEMSKLYEPKI